MISDHASPLAAAGGVDSGGQNIYVAQVARNLARLGYAVDVFTRRDDASQPEILDWQPRVRVIHVPAGPPQYVRKEDLLPLMDEFCDYVRSFCATSGGGSVSSSVNATISARARRQPRLRAAAGPLRCRSFGTTTETLTGMALA